MLERLASQPRWLAGILIGLVLAAYLPVILHGGYIWDDDVHMYENPYVQAPDGLGELLTSRDTIPERQWYPVTMGAFWLQHRLWGQSPRGYHLVNVLLHAGTALLLWRILSRLEFRAAWFAAALFAVHPVCVESVAWISELKNTLSGFFYMSCAYLFVSHLTARQPRDRIIRYLLSLPLFMLALGAKTTAVSLPVAMLLVLWWRREWPRALDVLKTTPYFAVGLFVGLRTAGHEVSNVGAQGPEFAFTFLDRVMIAGRAAWFYIGKVLLPYNLTFFYPRWHIDAGVWWQWLFPLSGIALLVALFLLRRRIGRGPCVALSFFVAAAFPALGFFDVYPFRFSFVADHFQYLASIGTITAVAGGGMLLARRLDWSPRVRYAACGALLVLLGGVTAFQCGMYRNDEALYRVTLARNPGAWIAHTNLANIERRRGNVREAEVRYRAALAAYHNDYGHQVVEPGQRPLGLWQAHKSLGELLRDRKQYDESRQHLESALRLEPSAETCALLGGVYFELGNAEKARQHFEIARTMDPDHPSPYSGMARMHLAAKQYKEARQHYLAARERYEVLWSAQPGKHDRIRMPFRSTLVNLAACCLYLRLPDEAERHLRRALEVDPDDPTALTNLGIAQAEQGRPGDAARTFERAVTRHSGARNLQNLIRALVNADDLAAARRWAAKASESGVPIPDDLVPRLQEE